MQEEASAHKASHLSAALRAPRALTPLVLFMGFLGATLPSLSGWSPLRNSNRECLWMLYARDYQPIRWTKASPSRTLSEIFRNRPRWSFHHTLCLFDRMSELLPQWRGRACSSVYHHNDYGHILRIAVWKDCIKLPGITPPTAHTKKTSQEAFGEKATSNKGGTL